MTDLDFPVHLDVRGRTAGTDFDDHVRDLVEQVLFTAPGERVNRPTFGSGLMQLVFDPNGAQLASATQMLVQGALQQWLSDVIQVESVDVDNEDSTLVVTVVYRVRRTQARQVARLEQAI